MIDKSLIIKYLNGELDPAESEQVLSWLSEDKSNREELFSLKEAQLGLRMEQCPDRADTVSEWRRLKRTLKDRRRPAFPWKPLAAAAVAVLLLLAGWGVGRKAPGYSPLLSGEVCVKTGVGQQTQTRLPDGTTLLLNDCSELAYDPVSWKGVRQVRLEGQAAFHVRHMDGIPFLIQTKDYSVRVTGTSLDVSCYPEEGRSIVSLKEGKLSVVFRNGAHSVELNPGDALLFDSVRNTYTVQRPSDGRLYAWEENKICFDGNTLREKAGEIYRRFGYKMEIEDSCSHYRYTAVFDDESLKDLLEILVRLSPDLCFKIDADTRTVRLWNR